jgi:hypothetical protein
MKDWDYFAKHSQEWSEKYPGRYVAVVGNRLAAVSDSGLEAYKRAKKRFPRKEIFIGYLPREEELVHLL